MPGAPNKRARHRAPYEDPSILIDFEKALTCTTKDERIDFLVFLMADGRYVSGHTRMALAETWKLSESSVQEYIKAAASALRVLLGGYQEIRSRAVAVFDRIHTESLERARTVKSQRTAAAFYKVSLEAARGMLAFADREVDEARFDGLHKAAEPPVFKVEIVAPERPMDMAPSSDDPPK